jgi:hypothetical protein
MRKNTDRFVLYTHADGSKIELTRGADGRFHDAERANLRRDLARLLELTTQAAELGYNEYNEIETIGLRHRFAFDDDGNVIAKEGE